MPHRIALVKWAKADGIAAPIAEELNRLGHQPVFFDYDQRIPSGVDIVLTFAPYNRLYPIASQIDCTASDRPKYIHWNFECLPDLRLFWAVLAPLGALRSRLDRLGDSRFGWARFLASHPPLAQLGDKMFRYRYLGEYRYFCQQGWLQGVADISAIYTDFYRQHRIPAFHVPWGTPPSWYADLKLERDIDVLWMGKRRTKRRSDLLDRLVGKFKHYGLNVLVADGITHPFIYDDERTKILNRTKIVLNLLTTPHDQAIIFRFHMTAGNRAMLVSEPCQPHSPKIQPGIHYIESGIQALFDQIIYYLSHEDERNQITKSAYDLVTQQLTLQSSIQMLMNGLDNI